MEPLCFLSTRVLSCITKDNCWRRVTGRVHLIGSDPSRTQAGSLGVPSARFHAGRKVAGDTFLVIHSEARDPPATSHPFHEEPDAALARAL